MDLDPIGFFVNIKYKNQLLSRLTTNQGKVLFAVAAVCISIFLLMASRAASRFFSHQQTFHKDVRLAGSFPPAVQKEPPKPAKTSHAQNVQGTSTAPSALFSSTLATLSAAPPAQEESLPADLIPRQVRTTLDSLLGSPGAVDRLPSIPGGSCNPSIAQMKYPIMKGLAENPKTKEKLPYIAIKMRSLSNEAELVEKWELGSETLKHLDLSKPIESVITLYPHRTNEPLMWEELEKADFRRPSFFTWNFTYLHKEEQSASQMKNFLRLRHVLVTGAGADAKGVRWEIMGHSKQVSPSVGT